MHMTTLHRSDVRYSNTLIHHDPEVKFHREQNQVNNDTACISCSPVIMLFLWLLSTGFSSISLAIVTFCQQN